MSDPCDTYILEALLMIGLSYFLKPEYRIKDKGKVIKYNKIYLIFVNLSISETN